MSTANDWQCARCLRKPPHVRRRGPSAICQQCHADLAALGQRWCRECNAAYPVENFPQAGTDERGVVRRSAVCWQCLNRHRAADEQYKERQRLVWQSYYERNREAIAERRRAERAARADDEEYREKQRRACRDYYARHREKILAHQRERYARNRIERGED